MKHRLIFVGGLQRSGTTLLFRCLRDHPDISGFSNTGVPVDEGQFLQSVYTRDGFHGGPGRFGFDPAAFLDECSPLASVEAAKTLFQEWSQHWDLGKRFLLEKTPQNLIRSRFLQALFPDAFFIMIVRHPVAVAYGTQRIWGGTIHSLLDHWLVCHERFEVDRQYLRNLFVLKYEAFVNAPETVLKRVCAFLGLGEASLQQQLRTRENDKYFALWRAAQNGKHPGSYTNYPYLVNRFESRVNRFGYSLLSDAPAQPYQGDYYLAE